MFAFLRKFSQIIAVLIMSSTIPTPPAFAQLPPLIPRATLLGNPERADPHIAPDGKRLAWLAPDEHGVLQVWVQTIGQHDARPVTADKSRGIQSYGWAYDSKTIIYAQDAAGDENFHLFAVDLDSNNVRDLTPWQGVRAEFVAANPKFPGRMLVALNLRDRKLMDVYRVDLRTGAVELDTKNPGDVGGWLADDNMIVRAASITTPDGGTEIRIRDSAAGPWRTLMKAGMEDNLAALDFTKDGQALFLSTSIGTDTARLVRHEIVSGKETVIAQSDAADLSDVMIQPTRHVVQAAALIPAGCIGRLSIRQFRPTSTRSQKLPTAISPSPTAISPTRPGWSRSRATAHRCATTRGIARRRKRRSCSACNRNSTTRRSRR